jgi:hypothetical protein
MPPLVPIKKSQSKCYSYDFKGSDGLKFEIKTKSRCDGSVHDVKPNAASAYSYFGKSRPNPEDEDDSPWDA